MGGLQPIPGDPAMLDDRTFCFVIQHGRHREIILDNFCATFKYLPQNSLRYLTQVR